MKRKFLKISHSIKYRYIQFKFKIFKFFKVNTIRSSYGINLKSNYNDLTFKFYFYASYGFFYWNRLKAINRKFVFLDIGANQGLYTIGSTKNISLIKAYAFEPVEKTFSFLLENVKLNRATHRCTLIKKGVSNQTKSVDIKVPEHHSGGASLEGKSECKNFSTFKIELICASDLEKIVKERDYPIILKIDVEGHEQTVIEELFKTEFANLISEIFLEVDESLTCPNKIITFLKEQGFSKFRKIGVKPHYDLLVER